MLAATSILPNTIPTVYTLLKKNTVKMSSISRFQDVFNLTFKTNRKISLTSLILTKFSFSIVTVNKFKSQIIRLNCVLIVNLYLLACFNRKPVFTSLF